ncbi:MAG: GNAT family N-acetyltransferase [Actinobacteria bacterium]|nr:GNAT family N-acetyltransferase [Actinomycetota bacterium]
MVDLRMAFLREEYDTVDDPVRFRAEVADFVERATTADRWWSWLAEDGGAVVGGLSMLVQEVPPHPRDPRRLDGFVFNVWVAPTQRRQGIGRRLVDACLDAARADGLRRVALVATDDGRSLYEAAGFASDPDLLRLRLDP